MKTALAVLALGFVLLASNSTTLRVGTQTTTSHDFSYGDSYTDYDVLYFTDYEPNRARDI